MRFSKLLGFGRVTSLPKVWKGTRKRKKSKQAESLEAERVDSSSSCANDKSKSNPLQTIHEENTSAERLNSIDGEDVFKLFDDEFSGKKTSAISKPEPTNGLNTNKEKVVITDDSKVDVEPVTQVNKSEEKKSDADLKEPEKEQDNDVLEYETDDEVRP